MSASAMSIATHTGKPVNGRLEPAMLPTAPSTPPCDFGLVRFAVAPSTAPDEDGAAAAGADAGADAAAGACAAGACAG